MSSPFVAYDTTKKLPNCPICGNYDSSYGMYSYKELERFKGLCIGCRIDFKYGGNYGNSDWYRANNSAHIPAHYNGDWNQYLDAIGLYLRGEMQK